MSHDYGVNRVYYILENSKNRFQMTNKHMG
jgi:hypothetical protein